MTDLNKETQHATPSRSSRKRAAWAADLVFDNDIAGQDRRRNSDIEKENTLLKQELSELKLNDASLKEIEAQRQLNDTDEITYDELSASERIRFCVEASIEKLKEKQTRLTEIVDDLEGKEEELREAATQQLKKLVSRDDVDRLARKDETLRTSRQFFLVKLLKETEVTQDNERKEEISREEWAKSLWYWQNQRDDERSEFDKTYNHDVGAWTTKEILENRKKELEEFAETRDQNRKRLRIVEGLLEKVDDQRIKAWRDIVVELLGEPESTWETGI